MNTQSTEMESEEEPETEQVSLDEELDMFEKHLKNKTELTDGSIKHYISKINKLDEPLDFERMTVQEIIDQLNFKISRAEGRSAIKHYLSYLRRTKKWPIETRQKVAYVELELDNWSLKTSSGLSKEDVKRKFLRVNEISEFHKHLNEETGPTGFKQDVRKTDEFKLLPVFLFETACRIEEALSIKLDNINWTESTIKLTNTKRDKIRKVNFDRSRVMLRELVKKHDIEGDLFELSREDDYKAVNTRFKRVGENLFGRNVTTHWFRHSFATNRAIVRMQKGVSKGEIKDEIKEYLGHESVDTTEKYIGAASELERDNIYKDGKTFDLEI